MSSWVFHWFTFDSFLVPFRIQRNSRNLLAEVPPPRFYQTHDLNPMMMSRSMEATVCFEFRLVSHFPNTRELLSWKFSREAYLLASFSSSPIHSSHSAVLFPIPLFFWNHSHIELQFYSLGLYISLSTAVEQVTPNLVSWKQWQSFIIVNIFFCGSGYQTGHCQNGISAPWCLRWQLEDLKTGACEGSFTHI